MIGVGTSQTGSRKGEGQGMRKKRDEGGGEQEDKNSLEPVIKHTI